MHFLFGPAVCSGKVACSRKGSALALLVACTAQASGLMMALLYMFVCACEYKYMFVCVQYISVCRCACMCVHVEGRGQPWVLFLGHWFFELEALTGMDSLDCNIGWSALEPVSTFSELGLKCTPPIWAFLYGFWGWNSGPHACTESTLNNWALSRPRLVLVA